MPFRYGAEYADFDEFFNPALEILFCSAKYLRPAKKERRQCW